MAFRLQGRIDRPWRFLAIAIVLVIVVLFYVDWRGYSQARTESDQTRTFIEQTNSLLSSVKDAETGQRGYLLTGDRKYLTSYDRAAVDLPKKLDELTRAATSFRREVNQVAQIRSLVNSKMAELKHTIDLRDTEGDEAVMAFLHSGDGTLTMDEVRTQCELMAKVEEAHLYELERDVAENAKRSRLIVLVGCIGLVFLLFRLGAAVDTVVAEREQFARNVEDSRQLLQTTLASIGDAVIVTDAEGAIRFMNPVAESLTGWEGRFAATRPLDRVFHLVSQETGKVVENPYQTVHSNGSVPEVAAQILLVASDGRELPIEESSAPIRDEEGKILGAVIVFRDVTTRRIAERELERWKKIFAGAGFGMFVLDPATGKVVDANPTFAAMHGYSVSELLGSPLSAMLRSESREDFAAALRTASGEGRHVFEYQHLRRDGTEFPALIDLTTFQNGRQELWAGYCSDITERKRFEDTLRESEERFRTLANTLPQLVWSTDASGNVEYVNDVWTAYAGFGSDETARKYLPHEPWTDVLHPEDRDQYRQKWREALSTGRVFETQVRLRRAADGGYRWFLCRAVAVRDRNGKVVRWLGGCTDVQQQTEDAAQLKMANHALRQSNDDLEQFAYAASHDLQEPLRMVSIYSQLLKEEYAPALDTQAVSYIEFAVNGAMRMSNLLRALLTYSRVANVAPQPSQKSDACSAVSAALLNLSAMIEKSQARVEVEPLPVVQIPEIHLVQLFQNLIGNGLKYCKDDYPEGEAPTIRISALRQQDGLWRFCVEDNGIGIESEYLTQIFGIFKRLHGAGFEGTGIGLALCQKIVERAGGHIWVESEPGEGSKFFFTLPGANTGEDARAYYNSAG